MKTEQELHNLPHGNMKTEQEMDRMPAELCYRKGLEGGGPVLDPSMGVLHIRRLTIRGATQPVDPTARPVNLVVLEHQLRSPSTTGIMPVLHVLDELLLGQVALHTSLWLLHQAEEEQRIHDADVNLAQTLQERGINARVEDLQDSLLQGEADELQVRRARGQHGLELVVGEGLHQTGFTQLEERADVLRVALHVVYDLLEHAGLLVTLQSASDFLHALDVGMTANLSGPHCYAMEDPVQAAT
jgi:hypothetical protein